MVYSVKLVVLPVFPVQDSFHYAKQHGAFTKAAHYNAFA